MNIIKKQIIRISNIWKEPSIGFGDTFAKITKTFGIKPCGACNKRRKKWNEALKYHTKS